MLRRSIFSAQITERYPVLLPSSERQIAFWGDTSRQPLAYAYEGVSHIPVPVFRWERGQNIDQTLLDLQMPLLQSILREAPEHYRILMADASSYIRLTQPLAKIPEADVVCFGLWVEAQSASQRRMLCCSRKNPTHLDFVLENLSVQRLGELNPSHLLMQDSGIWLLSERAAKTLVMPDEAAGEADFVALNAEALAELDVVVLPLNGAEYYDFGTTRSMQASTMILQNVVLDQRLIIQKNLSKHPSLFTQNACVEYPLSAKNDNVWIENSHVPASWSLASCNVITGVPENNWSLNLLQNQCVSVVPVRDSEYAALIYDYDDESAPHYRLCGTQETLGSALLDLLKGNVEAYPEIATEAINLVRLQSQRRSFLKQNLTAIAANHRKSVFYQVNLKDMAQKFAKENLALPAPLPEDAATLLQIRDAMFRSQLQYLRGEDGTVEEARAFSLLREGLTQPAFEHLQHPHLDVYKDQIVWGRSAVRIDIAGGWTDTPPYCLNAGGNVVNMAIELNGQQPLQVYVKPCKELKVICRSIDLGASEEIATYEELAQFNKVGSPFSIPKAALALCGFLPQFAQAPETTLQSQLAAFGSGIEITLLSAIPAGSGLGTSSILAATVLGALSDFCGLGWDKSTICNRTLILEQLLTTGGGWQDQFGGVLHGVKLLQTASGFDQTPVTRWLPEDLWTDSENRQCHLLYYTGITRTAKKILAEIVRGMFLNSTDHLAILTAMKQQALDMFDAIQRGNMAEYGRLVRKTWSQNKALDSGTEPPLVYELCQKIDDLCSGYKLPGAGGGGYLYMVAKDPEAAARIKHILSENPLTDSSRFVDMRLSEKGLQVSRS